MAGTNRRRFLEAASSSLLALAGGCLTTPGAETGTHPVTDQVSEWPSFRGGAHNTGFGRGVQPTSSDPSITWTFDADDAVWGSPVVVDDTVYIGSADHSVYAIDAETGDERWAFSTDHRVEATPAYAEGTVYVGSYDRHVYAIDAATGDRRWKRELAALIRGSPTVSGDSLIVGVGCHNLACAEYAATADVPRNGWVYSLDPASGETNWRYEVGDEVVSTPAIDGDTVYVGASDGSVYALDVATGDVAWTYDAHDMVWSSPAVAFESVFVGDWDGFVHAIDAATGELEWETDTFANYISGSVSVDEDSVYVGTTPLNSADDPNVYYGEMVRLDRSDGAIDWTFETTALEIGSSPVVTDDRLYVGTHRQTESDGAGVHALTTDGQGEWFMEIGQLGVGSSPALVDGTLYFGGVEGTVFAVE